MRKFEYKIETIAGKEIKNQDGIDSMNQLLNDLGKEGWELVGTETRIGEKWPSGTQ